MNYIVLDLEWNQCPTGKENEIEHLPFEIIEVGAIRLNDSLQKTDQFHEVIQPQFYKSLHFRTREVISLCDEDLEAARCFPDVIQDFFSWCGEDPVFCTWGPADLTELQRNLTFHHLPLPFSFPLIYFDIQKIFSIIYEDRKSRRSLEYAVDFLHIAKDIPFHSALSDALYTAQIVSRLTPDQIADNSSIDYFQTPKNRRQEVYLTYQTYTKFVSKPFDSKVQVMKDRVVISTTCTKCKKNLSKKIRWFAVGGRNYCCLAYCEKHGYIKGKIRIRQNENGQYYAIKTIKPVSEDIAYEIKEKKEVLRLKRRLRKAFAKQNKN